MQKKDTLSNDIAKSIISNFDRHFRIFQELTFKAKKCFEVANWQETAKMSKKRIYLYDKRIKESVSELKQNYKLDSCNEELWHKIKRNYTNLLYNKKQPELAETFFNSVFCSLFDKKFYNNNFIFVKPSVDSADIDLDNPVIHGFRVDKENIDKCFEQILNFINLKCKYIDFKRDIKRLQLEFKKTNRINEVDSFEIEIIKEPFFRNKAVYIIGRITTIFYTKPLCIVILNDKDKGLYVDALLMSRNDISKVFSFTRAYFMVKTEVPAAIVDFLLSILPSKNKADLYSAIGFHKQGKTLLYRMFLKHVKTTDYKLKVAPGVKGMVMAVFTFPVYPYVFKLIRDHFEPSKNTSREDIKNKYSIVKNHDRIGRLADTWEFSNVAFPIDKINKNLLKELQDVAPSSLEFVGDLLIIKHLYVEKRMKPLDIHLQEASKEEIDRVIKHYGIAIKELIRANIFPGDMLFKNFGITRQNQVVFYDYDEITTMSELNFRKIPEPQSIEDEMSAEPWYYVAPNDVFPEEFGNFLFFKKEIKEAFLKYHKDLLDPKYWQKVQKSLTNNEIIDVFPYKEDKRMCNIY